MQSTYELDRISRIPFPDEGKISLKTRTRTRLAEESSLYIIKANVESHGPHYRGRSGHICSEDALPNWGGKLMSRVSKRKR